MSTPLKKSWQEYFEDPNEVQAIIDELSNQYDDSSMQTALASFDQLIPQAYQRHGKLKSSLAKYELIAMLDPPTSSRQPGVPRTHIPAGDEYDFSEIDSGYWEQVLERFAITQKNLTNNRQSALSAYQALHRLSPKELVERRSKTFSLDLELARLNDEFFRYLEKHPECMHEVSPRRFEEIVAELFKGMGCTNVELTPQTRDKGRDIIASLETRFGTLLIIVECKKYRPDRPVGVNIVERLFTTIDRRDNSSCGLVATTSYFEPAAEAFANQFKYRLMLRDFEHLKRWVADYGKWIKCKDTGLWIPNV